MHCKVVCCLVALVCTGLSLDSAPVAGQQLPREDVIHTPAKHDGLSVSNLFQSNMVLQRDKPIQVWGWAQPEEAVTVSLEGESATVKAAADGSWKATLPALPVRTEPLTMTIAGKSETLELENLLVGDVWILGGQSNMEFELAKVENGMLEIVSANYPQIRVLTVPYGEGPEKVRSFARLHEWSSWFSRHFEKGNWDECTPEVAKDLSAIGYVFARRVHKASGVPIGVIDASRGGTTVEAWTPREILAQIDHPAVQQKLTEWDEKVAAWDPQQDLERRINQHRQRVARLEQEGKPIPADLENEPNDLLPGPIADTNYPGNCYAGMLAPLEGLSVKGAIFHQGFNNAFDGSRGVELYGQVFPRMIAAWREAFHDAEMPFGIISLCTDGYPQTLDNYCEFMHNAGVDLRAVQYQTFLDLQQAGDENVGFASTYDLRRRWYHPQLKLPAGERIARWALATEYGMERLEWKPPMIVGVEVREQDIVLEFDTQVNDPGDGDIVGFSIAGADRRFQPAKAVHFETGKDDRGRVQYDRKRLVLSSPLVEEPIHYRYAWGRNPLANLQAMGNKDLPVATQRSDDWKLEEVPLHVIQENEGLNPRALRGAILNALREQDLQRRIFEARELLQEHAADSK